MRQVGTSLNALFVRVLPFGILMTRSVQRRRKAAFSLERVNAIFSAKFLLPVGLHGSVFYQERSFLITGNLERKKCKIIGFHALRHIITTIAQRQPGKYSMEQYKLEAVQ